MSTDVMTTWLAGLYEEELDKYAHANTLNTLSSLSISELEKLALEEGEPSSEQKCEKCGAMIKSSEEKCACMTKGGGKEKDSQDMTEYGFGGGAKMASVNPDRMQWADQLGRQLAHDHTIVKEAGPAGKAMLAGGEAAAKSNVGRTVLKALGVTGLTAGTGAVAYGGGRKKGRKQGAEVGLRVGARYGYMKGQQDVIRALKARMGAGKSSETGSSPQAIKKAEVLSRSLRLVKSMPMDKRAGAIRATASRLIKVADDEVRSIKGKLIAAGGLGVGAGALGGSAIQSMRRGG